MINTFIQDHVIEEAAFLYGTPLLCYEQKEIEKSFSALKNSLPNNVSLAYSLKAGPNPYLIQYYMNKGLFFEVASEGELAYLLSLEVPPAKIIVSGQGKTEEYLCMALDKGITKFNIESVNELILLENNKRDKCINCSIRINPNFSNNHSILKMGGVSSAFGIDESQLLEILLKDKKRLINGIFMYAGSQYFLEEDIVFNTEYLFKLCIDIYEKTNIQFEFIDFGGGFGVPEDDSDGELNLIQLQTRMERLFAEYTKHKAFQKIISFIFESGRYLSARTAVLITKVLDIKESLGKKFIITDMGINALGVKQREYRIYSPIVKQLTHRTNFEEYIIVGRTCTPIDQTHPKCILSKVKIGDLLYIVDCGAYSLTFSPNNFCGLARVAEVVHTKNAFILTNRRELLEEVYGRTVIKENLMTKSQK